MNHDKNVLEDEERGTFKEVTFTAAVVLVILFLGAAASSCKTVSLIRSEVIDAKP